MVDKKILGNRSGLTEPLGLIKQAENLEKTTQYSQAVEHFGHALRFLNRSEHPEYFNRAREGLIRVGGPWIEHDSENSKMRMFNVPYQNLGRGDTQPRKYNFYWDMDFYTLHHNEDKALIDDYLDIVDELDDGDSPFEVQDDYEENMEPYDEGIDLTYQLIREDLEKGNSQKVVPDLGEFFATKLFLDSLIDRSLYSEELLEHLNAFSGKLYNTTTSTHYDTSTGELIHNAHRSDEFRIEFALPVSPYDPIQDEETYWNRGFANQVTLLNNGVYQGRLQFLYHDVQDCFNLSTHLVAPRFFTGFRLLEIEEGKSR